MNKLKYPHDMDHVQKDSIFAEHSLLRHFLRKKVTNLRKHLLLACCVFYGNIEFVTFSHAISNI